MKRLFRLLVAVVTVGAMSLLAACGGGGSDGAQTTPELSGYIDIKGSDTMVNLGQAWAEAFMDTHPKVQIAVTGGGSGTGIAQLINNNTDIAQSSRAMKGSEFDDAARRGVDVYEFIVGQDGLATAVHRDNPVKQLTTDQLKDIFTGKITDWAAVGWAAGGAISVYSRDSNSGTYVFFLENVLHGEDWAPGTRFMPGSAAINEALQTDKAGIGYYGVGYVDGVTALAVSSDGQNYYSPLNAADVDSGAYPLARPMFFYTNGAPEGLILEYLRWVLSDSDGQEIIKGVGFFPIAAPHKDHNTATFKAAGVN